MKFDDIKDQQKNIHEMIQAVDSLFAMQDGVRDGDLVDYTFVGEVTFLQQENAAKDVIFQIPESCDFFARRMMVLPSFRFVTPDTATNGADEISFRPCILSSTVGAFAPNFQGDRAAMDIMISIAESYSVNGQLVSRQLQNIPTPAQLFYSSPINYRGGQRTLAISATPDHYPSFQFPSAGVFPKDYFIPAGGSLTCRVAPNFAGVRSDPAEPGGDGSLQNEYKVTITLEGQKRVVS